MTTRTCIKSRKPFLFRFRRWEILKRQNYAKNGLPKFATRHSAQTGKFRKPNAQFWRLTISNTFFTFTGTASYFLFRGYQMPYEWNGNCVTVVVSTGLHFRAFYLLTFAASHDLKETIDKDYCECGMPLETIRESEAPLKERSERVWGERRVWA